MSPDEAAARSRSLYPGGALPDVVAWRTEEDHARIARHMHTRKLSRDTAALASRAYRDGLVYTSTQTQTRVAMCSSMSERIEDWPLKEEILADTKSFSLDGDPSVVTVPFNGRGNASVWPGPQHYICDGLHLEAYADS